MPSTKVDILMPVYNGAQYLIEALDSISAQTFTDFECIIVDDGSTDDTPSILKDRSAADPRFKIFHRPHKGIVGALNFGMGKCRAEYIARMDADDLSTPGRIEVQLNYMEQYPETSVAGCLIKTIPEPGPDSGMHYYEQWINSVREPADIALQIYIESPLPHPGVMIRRTALEKMNGWRSFDGPEDYDLWLRMNAAGFKLGKAPEILLHWRDTPGRLSRSDPRYSQDAFVELKAQHLSRDKKVSKLPVQIWGAGITGKAYAKALSKEGVKIARFIDINPRKIGQTISGVPVISPRELKNRREEFIIGAVGGRGARSARDEIREELTSMDFIEGKHFLFVA